MIWLGAVAAILIGVWLLSDYESSQGDSTLIDEAGDFFYVATTSEESRINDLQPDVQAAYREFLSRCHDAGLAIHTGQTLRTPAQERVNVDAGKTSATLKYSWHELGRAIDCYPMLNGAPDFTPTEGPRLDAYRAMHAFAVEIGFRSIAFNDDGSKRLITNSKGKKIWDGGHIEWREPYATIAEAVAVEGSRYGIV